MPIPTKRPTYRVATERLRAIREAQQVSREELAARLHCSVSRIAQVELAYHVPSINKLAEFAAALGVRVDDLLVLDEGVTA